MENDFNKLMIDKDEIVLKPLLDEDIPLLDRWLRLAANACCVFSFDNQKDGSYFLLKQRV